MDFRWIPRKAVDGSLRAARIPLDALERVARRDRDRTRPWAPRLVADRADAMARRVAGTVLRDRELVADATRRETAADERERALRLEAEAERRSRDATRQAEEERRRLEADRARRDTQVAQAERSRKAAVARAAARTEEAIEDKAKAARLAELDREAEVLRKEEAAVARRKRATNLEKAANTTKAARKAD